jgi:hypothetical protein
VDVLATTAIESGTVPPLNHATNVALGFLVAALAEILVDGIRVKRIEHFLLVQSLVATDTSETSIPETSTARGRSSTAAADFPAIMTRMMFSSPRAFRLLPALRSSWINRRRVSPEAKRAWSGGKQMFAGSGQGSP